MAMAGQGRRRVERKLLVHAASPGARARTRFLLRFVPTWGFLTLLALLVVSRSAATASADYQVDRLTSQAATLTAVHRSLTAQIEALSAAPRLERIAAQSGLVLPQTLVTLPVPQAPARAALAKGPGPRTSMWSNWARRLARLLRRLP